MICKSCGAELNDTEKFCSKCGAIQVPETAFCLTCGAKLKPNAKFCSKCGSETNLINDNNASSTASVLFEFYNIEESSSNSFYREQTIVDEGDDFLNYESSNDNLNSKHSIQNFQTIINNDAYKETENKKQKNKLIVGFMLLIVLMVSGVYYAMKNTNATHQHKQNSPKDNSENVSQELNKNIELPKTEVSSETPEKQSVHGNTDDIPTETTSPTLNETKVPDKNTEAATEEGKISCIDCNGARVIMCHNCFGKGTVTKAKVVEKTCSKCSGSGGVSSKAKCNECGGRGIVSDNEKVTENCTNCEGKKTIMCKSCDGIGTK